MPKRYLHRLLFKLMIFELINIILDAILLYISGDSFNMIILRIGRSIIFYPSGALWYLQAVIVAVLLLIPFYRLKGGYKLVVPIGLVLYTIALLTNNYYFIIEDTFFSNAYSHIQRVIFSTRNGLFMAFLYVGIGMNISLFWDKILKIRPIIIAGIVVAAYGLLVLEVFLIKNRTTFDDSSLYISYIVLIPAIFCLSALSNYKITINTKIIRSLSTSLYLLHAPLITCIQIICKLATGNLPTPVLLSLILIPRIASIVSFVYVMYYKSNRLVKIYYLIS